MNNDFEREINVNLEREYEALRKILSKIYSEPVKEAIKNMKVEHPSVTISESKFDNPSKSDFEISYNSEYNMFLLKERASFQSNKDSLQVTAIAADHEYKRNGASIGIEEQMVLLQKLQQLNKYLKDEEDRVKQQLKDNIKREHTERIEKLERWELKYGGKEELEYQERGEINRVDEE